MTFRFQKCRFSGGRRRLWRFPTPFWRASSGSVGFRQFSSDVGDCSAHNNVGYPIVIVGGGPTGLFMAYLLQSYQVPFVLLEAQTAEQRFQHPQAHFLNTRSMEILKCASLMHPTESIYDKIRNAMPPVDEWNSFLFGPDMISQDKILAKLVHPVDRPLLADMDANGKLVDISKEDSINENKDNLNNVPLSDVTVGHLAQHTFCKILHDAVMQESTKGTNPDDSEATPQNEILYGNRVVGCTWDERTQRWNIHIDRNKCFQTSIIVAADGAKSFLRTDVLQIPMDGQATIQNLINVHFRVSEETEKRIPKAMLYTVFSKNALAMIVRHGPGEYVMQVPYFDPYQTPEQDFSMAKVKEMVGAALGGEEDDHDLDFDIHSIRPWSMGSLVARDYFSKKGIFLAGDAAHVFPPAGGFGMNTGLQDVFSLAWRLSLLHENAAETTHWGTSGPFSIQEVGSLYQQERQPVARNNAALSVRNYQRVLGVMQACYLNHQHPTALIAALDATAPLVPMSTRQRAFQTLLQAALLPLGQLKNSPNGLFATRVKRNLQRLLGAGQGLPLLFPQHELDFSYGDKEGESSWHNDHWKNDSKALDKHLSVGTLFPHMSARVSADSIRKFPRLAQSESTKTPSSSSDIYKLVSTRDLATQLSSARSPCVFCVGEILISDHPTEEKSGELETLKKDLEERLEISCETVRIVVVSNAMSESLVKHDTNDSNPCTMFVDKNEWDDIKLDDDLASKSKLLVVIRPDGHVAAISSRNDAINIFQPTRKTLFIQ